MKLLSDLPTKLMHFLKKIFLRVSGSRAKYGFAAGTTVILKNAVDGFVGANSFARTISYVRMNSHLQERHIFVEISKFLSSTAFFRVMENRRAENAFGSSALLFWLRLVRLRMF